jgi:hypothetical protein
MHAKDQEALLPAGSIILPSALPDSAFEAATVSAAKLSA